MKVTIALALAAFAFTPAIASAPVPLTGSMGVTYYTVTAGGAGDFETYCCSDSRTDLTLTALGPNGLPVYNTSSVGPQTLTGVDSVTGELQWWTPGVTNGGDTVVQTGTALVPFPYSNFAFFPPNGSGGDDSNGFQTAHFASSLNLGQTSDVTFTLGGDDDVLLFIGGNLWTELGGVHGTSYAPTITKRLGAGSYSLDLFFADRHRVASTLDISGTYAVVPEPASWALMIAGFGMIGASLRRRGAALAA